MTRWGWTGERPQETPSPGWRPGPWRPALWRDLRLLWARMEELAEHVTQTVRSGNQRIERLLIAMAENSQAALAELTKDVRRLAGGYVAQQAKIALLETALAEADAVKAQAVADAIAADDAIDTAAIAEADALVEAVSPEPVVEPPVDLNA